MNAKMLLIVVALSLLANCIAAPYAIAKPSLKGVTLDQPWTRKRNRLVHPDKTIIILGKVKKCKGRLSTETKATAYERVTPNAILRHWYGGDYYFTDRVEFSKRWDSGYGCLTTGSHDAEKFIWELAWINSPGNRYDSGRKVLIRHVGIYVYGGAKTTLHTYALIQGYSDSVQSHEKEFQMVIDQIVSQMKRVL